ncbi:hypothetical protein CLAFUW4_00593 [Fulvia fulva]|uniref:Yeast cell wall synthesis Kre9/Knh1-like N-terminal domain-containing protein n=1 Tax=Passalora fulva TaxID=5499 RepID=A0A1P8YY60_PASFU|nr:uncharacterized protein CLAFUR5_00592 [Fulvia fulva]AQA29295.1 hypothetical protein 2 [Fulvia fulva]KAK4635232.1 hypothetical protein CLAFUR4_00594 [Fulvia fulva]KAK4636773.1 hypothetical protein CLAFUR0_00595 [Fulvia fulva]UJO11165.1 hypothetical protein CLAFUR5_00592 [Fulvia fulva]WPV09138.1 hypothetical protein CLAFUW4_00593 [Fulvia fulva]
MFAKALFVGVLAAFAAAQGTSSTLYFTRVPSPITAGQQTALTYATGDTTSPVTILLRKGNPGDLKTVATLTDSATNGQYIWSVDRSLENGADYALEIKQGNELNYFGPFQIQGGGQGGSSSSSSASGSMTSHGSSSAIATMTVSQNSSAITTATISAGTGTSMSRNQTMSSATLTRTSSESATETPAGTSGAGFQGSQTSASAPASTGAASSLVATGGSALALAFGAVAAIFFC